MKESDETEEISTFPLYPYLQQEKQVLPNCKPISVGRPGDVRNTIPSSHATTQNKKDPVAKHLKQLPVISIQLVEMNK